MKCRNLNIWVSGLGSTEQIDKKRKGTVGSFNSLRKAGMCNFTTKAELKSFMYKV